MRGGAPMLFGSDRERPGPEEDSNDGHEEHA